MVWLLSLQLLLESLLSQSRWPILANICWTISQSDWSHLGLCCCKEIFWDTRWGTLTHKCNLSTTWAPLLPIYLSFVGGEWEHSGSLNVTERWEAPGDPYCGKGSDCVFSGACCLSRFQWCVWDLGFLQKRPCWENSWSSPAGSESKLVEAEVSKYWLLLHFNDQSHILFMELKLSTPAFSKTQGFHFTFRLVYGKVWNGIGHSY